MNFSNPRGGFRFSGLFVTGECRICSALGFDEPIRIFELHRSMEGDFMYSDDIEKICALCVHAHAVKGTVTHMQCTHVGGYVPLSHTCLDFKYDVLKKRVRRKPPLKHNFTADDFKL